MSKLILWVGFLLSCAVLFLFFFVAKDPKFVSFLFWGLIFFGSGYKLFFAQPKK